MKNEDFYALTRRGERLEGGIRTALEAWWTNRDAAKDQYGPIASWNTSEITNMTKLFYRKADFNEDISRWDVSNVVDMSSTFNGATSFNADLSSWNVSNVKAMQCLFARATSFDRQLDGAWATSAAETYYMFYKSPGTIAGKTKDANGTLE